MADDFLDALARFHRDILMPEVREAIRESEQRQLDATLSRFDTIDRRFDRLEVEYHALAASVGRIELRIRSTGRDESTPPVVDELRLLRDKLAELQRRIDELESSAS